MLLVALALALGCSRADTALGPSDQPHRHSGASVQGAVAITVTHDTYVTSEHPNRTNGWKDSMDVARPMRAFVSFDQVAIAAAIANGTLVSATLRLTIGRAADNWGPTGRSIDAHRVSVPWTEHGATYNCAIDASPSNATKECSGPTEWTMTPHGPFPWVSPRTGTTLVTNGLTGVIEFNVTADVQAFLSGTPNHGWVIKKTDEEKQGRIVLMQKEGGAAAELLLMVSTPGADTSRPAMPATVGLPRNPAHLVAHPTDASATYLRDYVGIRFAASTSGSRIRDVLSQYGAEIVGAPPAVGNDMFYFVKVPDPGPAWGDLADLLTRIRGEAGVSNALALRFGEIPTTRGRYPVDPLVAPSRADWFVANAPTQAQRSINALNSIRAPLAWGCETGHYGEALPKIGVLDVYFDSPMTDLNVLHVLRPGGADSMIPGSTIPDDVEHGLAVAAVAGAIGNNGVGTAGVAWGAPLELFAMGTNGMVAYNQLVPLFNAINRASATGTHILSLSASFGVASDAGVVGEVHRVVKAYLDVDPKNIIVLALPEN